jgi:hypothetical protein
MPDNNAMTIELGGKLVELPHFPELPGGGFAFGLHKAGSSLLLKAVRRLVNGTPLSYFDFDLRAGLADIPANVTISPTVQEQLNQLFSISGVVFGGWRVFPDRYTLPLSTSTPTLLLIRDLRDCVTSHYFSAKFSHTTSAPGGAAIQERREQLRDVEIDEFVLSIAEESLQRLEDYERALSQTKLLLLRYEDIIFSKEKLLTSICTHFGIEVRPAKLARIARDLDERPASEDIFSHVRKVTPGDHRQKLKSSTIDRLNFVFGDALRRYNYI